MQEYLQHRLNLFYKYWQEMACLAAIFSREFWLCSLHPTAADFLPSDPSVGKAGVHAELWCVSLLPCGDDGSLFSFSLLAVLFFYVLLFSFFPSFSGERKSVLLHWWESLWIAKPQQCVLYFIQRRGARRFVAGSRLPALLRYMETALLGLGFC